MDDTRDELDRLIDGALASYSDAEPLAGLEARVVRRARVARARRRIFGWGLGIGVAASIAVLVVSWREQRPIEKPVEVARVTRAEEPTPTIRPMVRVRPAKRVRRPKALPKLEQFPAPTPLTAEERGLVALVRRDPNEAQQIFADFQKRADEPIEIQPIEIAPLRTAGAQ